jgi:transposase
VSDLLIVVEQWDGVRYATRDSYQRLLAEWGFSYQCTEKVYRSPPDAQTVADFEAALEKSDRFPPRPPQWPNPGPR